MDIAPLGGVQILEEIVMNARLQILVGLTAFGLLSAGCVITPTSGGDVRDARLPIGSTLLDSDRGLCAGTVAIDESSIVSASRSDLVVQRGQYATFEVDGDYDDDIEIDWTCVGSTTAVEASSECPDDTEFVRVTRETTGNEFLLECFGDRDD
jgi:hypothetical protein